MSIYHSCSPPFRNATFPLLLLTLLVSLPTANAQEANSKQTRRTKLPETVVKNLIKHHGVVYAKYGDRSLEIDLYRPRADVERKLPAIICVHGGGWWQGDRKSMNNVAMAIADQDYVTATLSYRLSGEAPFPAAIHDCKAAVRFLRAHADQYGIDSRHIGAIGLSAGGHLVALLGTTSGIGVLEGSGGYEDQNSDIQAVIPMGAQTNFRRHHDNIEASDPNPSGPKPNIWIQFIGGKPSETPDMWRLASPISHLDAADPPMMFITGENDNVTTHAVKFREKMKELEIDSGLTVIPSAPHAFLGRQEYFDHMVDAATGWFDRHLKRR